MDANGATGCLATLSQLTSPKLLLRLWPVVWRIAKLVHRFGMHLITAKDFYEFETQLRELLDEMGRIIVQWKLNSLSSSMSEPPRFLFWEGNAFSPKRLSPTRSLNCLFGKIRIRRWLHESCDGLSLPSLFPLELQLGIVAGVATPALARSGRTAVGRYDAASTSGDASVAASCAVGGRNSSQDSGGIGGSDESSSSSGSGNQAAISAGSGRKVGRFTQNPVGGGTRWHHASDLRCGQIQRGSDRHRQRL